MSIMKWTFGLAAASWHPGPGTFKVQLLTPRALYIVKKYSGGECEYDT